MVSINNNNNEKCFSCEQLIKSLNRLKGEKVELKDQILICEQKNIALNNIKIYSFKCIEKLNEITKKLSNNQNEGEINNEINGRKIDVNIDESDENVGEDLDEKRDGIDSLRDEYDTCFNDLNLWSQQLDLISSINKFPRFVINKYEDKCPKSPVRRSNRVSLPVEYFMVNPNPEIPETCKKLEKANNSPIKPSERIRCPFPGCTFNTRRGAVGLRDHSAIHKRRAIDSKDNVLTQVSKVSLTERNINTNRQLRCSYSDCKYQTTHGMYALKKHIQRMHSLNSSPIKSVVKAETVPEKDLTKTDSKANSKTKTQLRCSYISCKYSTTLGMHEMANHMRTHYIQNKTKIRANIIYKKSKNNSKTIALNSRRIASSPILRCHKCNYITKWGLSTLRKHLQIHEREQPFKCNHCDASYSTIGPLHKHKEQVHSEYRNPTSVEAMVTNPSHDRQRMTSNDFTDNCNSNRRKRGTHRCVICKKRFQTLYSLNRHKFNVHKIQHISNQAKDNPFMCPHNFCEFTTNFIGIFQKHVISHILEKKNRNENDITTEVKDNASKSSTTQSPQNVSQPVLFNFGSHLAKQTLNKTTNNDNTDINNEITKMWKKNTINNSLNSSAEKTGSISDRLMNTLLKNTEQEVYSCDADNCSFTTNIAEDWIKHNDVHELIDIKKRKTRNKCEFCRKSYKKLSQLEAHKRVKHPVIVKTLVRKSLSILDTPSVTTYVEKKFKCTFNNCKKTFLTNYSRRRHLGNVHKTKPTDYSSIPEGVEVIDIQLLNRSTNLPLNKCPLISCGSTFLSQQLMLTHFNNNHKSVDQHLVEITDESSRCLECGHLFKSLISMNGHLHVHRRKKQKNGSTSDNSVAMDHALNPMIGIEDSVPEKKGLQCQREGCGLWFESAFILREHLNLVHSKTVNMIDITSEEFDNIANESIHRCDICGFNFYTLYQLEDHMKSHTIEAEEVDLPLFQVDDYNNIEVSEELYDTVSTDPTGDVGLDPMLNNPLDEQRFEPIVSFNNSNGFRFETIKSERI